MQSEMPYNLDEKSSEYTTHPLIIKLQDLLCYAIHIITYSSIVVEFLDLDQDMICEVDDILKFACDMKSRCEYSLFVENFEDILKIESSINITLDNAIYLLALNEIELDKYLIYAQSEPKICSKFLINGFPMFNAADC